MVKKKCKEKYVLQSIYHNYTEGREETFVDGVYSTLEKAQKKMKSEFVELIDNCREVVYEDEDYDANMSDEEVAKIFYVEFSYDNMSFHLKDNDCCWDYCIAKVQ